VYTLFVIWKRLHIHGIYQGMLSPFRECPLMVEHLVFTRLEVLRNGTLHDLSLAYFYLISNIYPVSYVDSLETRLEKMEGMLSRVCPYHLGLHCP
jgi:hypothetical protein